MIEIVTVSAPELETYLNDLDKDMAAVRQQLGVEIKSYGHILRIALNTLQPESFDNLLDRVTINMELENALEFAGGYTMEYLGNSNPKQDLTNIITYLKTNQPKLSTLISFIEENAENVLVITDINDIDFLERSGDISNQEFITVSELKRLNSIRKTLVFYSFNGSRDFDFIYHLPADQITLVLYEQESQLYRRQVQRRKTLLEEEITNSDREQICGIKYIPVPDLPVNISQSIEKIVSKIDTYNSRSYNDYREETDSLLDEMEEKIIYKLTFDNNESTYLDSNESVFDEIGDLIKTYRVKIGDKIRIYPREEFAENLYSVAIETEPDLFGKVEEHSKFWKTAINAMRTEYGSDILYEKLKQKGLKVLAPTVESYGKGYRKFPMFNSDLRAIMELYYTNKEYKNLEVFIQGLLKSKTTYNSTMRVLGRGLRQEIRAFLKEKQVGEILEHRKFTVASLNEFVSQYMPLLTVVSKEIYNEQEELIRLIEKIEL
ncbi:MAG: hypothetical protein MI921_08455 [Cytophagales bacterium]|nr:hypothetical protein [Cytophagales bacterium]